MGSLFKIASLSYCRFCPCHTPPLPEGFKQQGPHRAQRVPWRLGQNTWASLLRIASLGCFCHWCPCRMLLALIVSRHCTGKYVVVCKVAKMETKIKNFTVTVTGNTCSYTWDAICHSGRFQSSQLDSKICQSCMNRSLFAYHHQSHHSYLTNCAQ